ASVEVFNLLNRPNVLDVDHVYGLADFAGPVPKEFGDHISSPGNPTFGSPKFAAEARQLQLSFRITFQYSERGDTQSPTPRLCAGQLFVVLARSSEEEKVKPYTTVGLIPSVRGIRRRKDIKINLEHLKHLVKAASWLSALDLPVRLIAFPEGALQAFNDEVLDLDHVRFARECAIDIPGEETEALGKIAREYNVFVIAQAKARHPDWKDRFFNVGFILNPRGKVILQHYKVAPLYPVEHSVCPHDVYDWWVEKYGNTLQAFWPVVDTEIGRLGIMMANEGSYPENARALAMNGAEVVYRASYPHPATGNEIFEIQSRARALDNNMYIVAPNLGSYYLFPEETTPIDAFGGRSFIINYKGQIVGRQEYGGGSTYVAGVID